ncbi:LysR family transcriptional regulator [Cupriavidus sp. USMAA2-4]|uniref:LysR family transcriptional regulator n=1 Tax=Cupriavidus malaysiensis TaxID=367825 RepID=A0ABM6F9P3_9BURK|nr:MULTISPECIES: LysR family transcriptional regulator [Cupriavidus]AOY95223.1 LysR family transcriptional regulator [Cupriavidus sp. USMAA2-4]AOZ01877.1 LysR family transcriptional regulator [Cupriavidus sp. USMAHM13]AOZ08386.1 LysR family transcriptional regulator [Cupriavidus malaysiensis]
MDLNAVKMLIRVAEARSFTLAAASLQMTQPGLSRAISRLEAELGVRLLHRTTRSVGLTPDGQFFYERCAPLLAELEQAEKLLVDRRCAPSGPFKLSMPAGLGRVVLLPLIARLAEQHPALRIESVMTDRMVDLSEEGFDAAVRMGPVPEGRIVVRTLGMARRVTVAAPSYLAAHGTPAQPEDLARHNCLTVRCARTGRLEDWLFARADGAFSVPVEGKLTFDAPDALVDAAVLGHGVVQVLAFMARDAIAAGRLVPVLEAFEGPGRQVSLVYPPSRQCSLKIGALVEALAQAEW